MANSLCQLSRRFLESTKHALWECEAVRHVWSIEFSWVNEVVTTHGSFMDLVELCVTKPEARELFGTTAWFIWSHRNKVRLNEKTLPLSRVGEAVKHLVQKMQSPVKLK